LTVNENDSLGFGEVDDLKAILLNLSALLVRPAPGRGADRRGVGLSWFVTSWSVLFAELENWGVVFGIFVVFAVFAVFVVVVFFVNILR
jgi:hypothetical protein